MDPPNINYLSGTEDIIDEIEPLWEGLNQGLMERSVSFKPHFRAMTFGKRKADLLSKSKGGKMLVDIAVDGMTGRKIGYCVSSVNKDMSGEVDSIFVDPEQRGRGIGDSLMRRAIAWLEREGASSIVVEVTVGNEGVLDFYARYGLLPRKLVLRRVKSEE